MMFKRRYLLLLFLLSAGGAHAILPPDASLREPEIRAQRIQMEKEYEERIQKRRDEATEAYKRATAAIDVPPWELDRVRNGKSGADSRSNAPQQPIEEKNPNQRILVSIVLLILIGSAVGWIRFKTRDVEQ